MLRQYIAGQIVFIHCMSCLLVKLIGEPGPDGPTASEDWVKQQHSSDPDVPLTYLTLRSLEPQTWYQLEVVAFNSIGWSPPNDLFIFQTRDGK